jgi:RNase P/RNase MRP subunit p30
MYHDLFIKWKSDVKELSRSRQIQEILSEAEYPVLALNCSMHQRPFPVLPSSSSYKTRLTVKANFSQLLNDTEALSRYDLIAARPDNEQDFSFCCTQGELDIISLKLHERMQMKIKLNLVHEAVKRGIMFEICYSQALRDMNARRVFIANASNLVKATKRKNIILSSEAEDIFEQRAPWDVINLACLLGLNISEAHQTIVGNPEMALEHGQARRVFKSTVEVMNKEKFLESYGDEYLPYDS